MTLPELSKRRDWFEEAAGDRLAAVERSALVQRVTLDDDTAAANAEIAERTGLSEADVAACPFFLVGSVAQLVDKIGRLRDELGITHYVIRDAEAVASIVAELT